jgi:hypothetical protein
MKANAASRASRRKRITAVTVFAALVCSGATSCSRTQVALSSAAIAAVVVGTTVGITYAVKHHHHTLQGCVFSARSSLKSFGAHGKLEVTQEGKAGYDILRSNRARAIIPHSSQ